MRYFVWVFRVWFEIGVCEIKVRKGVLGVKNVFDFLRCSFKTLDHGVVIKVPRRWQTCIVVTVL